MAPDTTTRPSPLPDMTSWTSAKRRTPAPTTTLPRPPGPPPTQLLGRPWWLSRRRRSPVEQSDCNLHSACMATRATVRNSDSRTATSRHITRTSRSPTRTFFKIANGARPGYGSRHLSSRGLPTRFPPPLHYRVDRVPARTKPSTRIFFPPALSTTQTVAEHTSPQEDGGDQRAPLLAKAACGTAKMLHSARGQSTTSIVDFLCIRTLFYLQRVPLWLVGEAM